MNIEDARTIMGKDFVGPDELARVSFLSGISISPSTPEVPFPEEVLRERKDTHILIFTPNVEKLTIVGFRELFGTDPAHEPCMYNQDWYLKEDFANTPPDGKWHLIAKGVREEARAKQPSDIESVLSGERFPSAITCALTFFAWWLETGGERLWKNDFLWCSDTDHNGDRIYVGRYEDPDGVNKNGFNIHRHLALRNAYSAALEIVS